MNWTLATNKQLETIIKFDNSCPHSLLSGAVTEMINRGLFDRIIHDCAKKIIKNIEIFNCYYHVGLDDLLQIGRIETMSCIKRYDQSKGKSFMSFAYMCITREIKNLITHLKAKKRDTCNTVSFNQENDVGSEIVGILPSQINVEKYVINKITVEQMLTHLTEEQKKIVSYRLQGYTFKEISKMLPIGNNRTICKKYNDVLHQLKGA